MLERDFGYKPPIPKELQKKYEDGLLRVGRWKGGKWREDINETDWHHVVDMFRVLQDISQACPTLSVDIDIQTVKHMIYLHDAGEIIVGDLTHNRDDYFIIHDGWKRKENRAFQLLTLFCIKDENIRTQARELYNRLVAAKELQKLQQESSDKEALLTELIDKDQGLRFGFENVFDARRKRRSKEKKSSQSKITPEFRLSQFNHSVESLTTPTIQLLKLVSSNTQEGLKNFLAEELERFSQYGYSKEAAPYIRNLDAILQ